MDGYRCRHRECRKKRGLGVIISLFNITLLLFLYCSLYILCSLLLSSLPTFCGPVSCDVFIKISPTSLFWKLETSVHSFQCFFLCYHLQLPFPPASSSICNSSFLPINSYSFFFYLCHSVFPPSHPSLLFHLHTLLSSIYSSLHSSLQHSVFKWVIHRDKVDRITVVITSLSWYYILLVYSAVVRQPERYTFHTRHFLWLDINLDVCSESMFGLRSMTFLCK